MPYFKLFFNMDDPQNIDIHDKYLGEIELKRKQKFMSDWEDYRTAKPYYNNGIRQSSKANPFCQRIDNQFRN